MKYLGLIACLMAVLGIGTAASARTIYQSGNVYHIKACDRPSGPGIARCHAHIVTDARGVPLTQSRTTMTLPPGYGPSQLRSAYKIVSSGSQTTIIAIVDAYGYTNAEADMGVYRSRFGLPACTSTNGCFAKYNESGVKGNYPAQNTGWAQETALDLAMASAMCPNCKIILVEANSATLADLGAAVNTAAKLGAHVITNSYGVGESGTQAYESAYNHPGVAITASAGDAGYGAQFPASSPHVTAVGGTSLYLASSTSRGWSETAWIDGGSGCSAVYAQPTWQQDTKSGMAKNTLCTMRMVADVSAVADPSTGVAVYAPNSATTSAWQVFGGTSVSSPLIGGIYAVNGGTVAYGSNPYASVTALNDVTSGTNGTCGGTYFCTAGAGFDGPTGLGTPKGSTAF